MSDKEEEKKEETVEDKQAKLDNEQRELRQLENGKYKLTIIRPDLGERFEKIHTKENLKETYKELKDQLESGKVQIAQIKKQIKNLDVEDNKELRDFIELQQKAMRLSQKKQKEDILANMLRDFDKIKDQMREISTAIPELRRNK